MRIQAIIKNLLQLKKNEDKIPIFIVKVGNV